MSKTTASLAKYEAHRPKQHTVQCWFTTRLTDQLRREVTEAYEAGYSAQTIADTLTEDDGVPIGKSAVNNHFIGKCGCSRD